MFTTFTMVFSNVLVLLLFLLESIVAYAGGQDDSIAFATGSQPEFTFQQPGTARS